MTPQQQAAQAEAEKRERHKSPSVRKNWQAVYTPERGWHVALVDDPRQVSFEAHAKARDALRRGDPAFFDLAADALLARCRMMLASDSDRNPEGEDGTASSRSDESAGPQGHRQATDIVAKPPAQE